jgi:hypothetical protein
MQRVTRNHRRTIQGSALALGLGLVASCNLYNPGGSGSYPDDADALIDLGQRDLQALRFEQAWTRFGKALALDSTKSMAYQGLAKAGMGRDSFSLPLLVDLAERVADAPDTAKLGVLATLSQSDMNRTYRPMMRTAAIYQRLRHRDSLGLADGVFASHLIVDELNAILSTQSYFRLFDSDRDTVVSPVEMATLRLITLTASGGIQVDPDKLLDPSQVDDSGQVADSTVQALNGVLTNVSAMTQDTNLFREVQGSIATDSNSATSQVSQQALDFIGQLGTSTSFYLVNDSLDNDGDGCLNEEIYGDSLDNDGDSLVDEDARIGYQASKVPVAGKVSMVSPSKYSLQYALETSGGLQVVSRASDDLVWSDATGLLRPWAGLNWVRWDAAVNDSVYKRVLGENGFTGVNAVANARKSSDYGRIRSLAIVEVRKKVLAKPADRSRVEEGKLRVGGCWNGL